jgi:hypothetical protein
MTTYSCDSELWPFEPVRKEPISFERIEQIYSYHLYYEQDQNLKHETLEAISKLVNALEKRKPLAFTLKWGQTRPNSDVLLGDVAYAAGAHYDRRDKEWQAIGPKCDYPKLFECFPSDNSAYLCKAWDIIEMHKTKKRKAKKEEKKTVHKTKQTELLQNFIKGNTKAKN